MAKQSDKKVLDRILNYPHHEKGCSYICGPHLEPCVMVRYHDGDCECTECHPLTGGKLRQMSKQESLEAQLAQAIDYCNELQAELDIIPFKQQPLLSLRDRQLAIAVNALESISGAVNCDYAIRRADEALAEISFKQEEK